MHSHLFTYQLPCCWTPRFLWLQITWGMFVDVQEEVREFASGVVLDALKIAVNFHGGAFDSAGVRTMPA